MKIKFIWFFCCFILMFCYGCFAPSAKIVHKLDANGLCDDRACERHNEILRKIEAIKKELKKPGISDFLEDFLADRLEASRKEYSKLPPVEHSDFSESDIFDLTRPHYSWKSYPFLAWDDALKRGDKEDFEWGIHYFSDTFGYYDADSRWWPIHGWSPDHWSPGHTCGALCGKNPDAN